VVPEIAQISGTPFDLLGEAFQASEFPYQM
jgi:hypothetical protein